MQQAGAFSTDPSTGERGEVFPWLGEHEAAETLSVADRGGREWRRFSLEDRIAVLRRVGAYFRLHSERFAQTMAAEMGKPIRQGRAEVEKCAALCDWYADHGGPMLADEATPVGPDAYVSFLPLGLVLMIAPWNFPLWQAMRGTVPGMLAGNGILLKHAPNCVRSAFHVEEAFLSAGAPRGAFSVLNVHQDQVEGVIADHRVAAVSVTGSVRAGSAVAAIAGRHIKKTVLELGGSDPFIVLADADLDGAVKAAVAARFLNSGQVCIAAKRMIVEAPVVDEFTTGLIAAVKAMKVGDPRDEDTDIGPMARRDLRAELDGQVRRTIEEGATLLLGGETTGPAEANFYAPTVLSGVRPGMTAFREETFGPVAAIIVARDADDAMAMANDSEFGLSGAIWTADTDRAKAMARELETGGVFINGFAASDPRTPIGGIKHSGYGRELSHYGLREFTNPQIVWKNRP